MPAGPVTSLANQDLRDAAARLVAERGDLPPGSVLRCFSRAVRAALLRGCAPDQVVVEAERLTQELLARRPIGERRHGRAEKVIGPRVPRPRRAS